MIQETRLRLEMTPDVLDPIGISLFDYIGRLRVENARALLESSSASIGRVALQTGFYDSSYFSRSFRRYTGMSPFQYRQLCRKRAQ
jgi:two-component system response regulator YesN